MYKYSATSNKHKKRYRQSTFAKMKDKNTNFLQLHNTIMTGSTSTEPSHMNQRSTKRHVDKSRKNTKCTSLTAKYYAFDFKSKEAYIQATSVEPKLVFPSHYP